MNKSMNVLSESENIFHNIIEGSSDPIFSITKEGKYIFVNTAFAKGLNKIPADVIGKTFWDIFPKNEADIRFAAVAEVCKTAKGKVIEVRVPKPDGDTFHTTSITPVQDAEGKINSVVCVSKNITLLIQQQQEIVAQSKLLNQQNEEISAQRDLLVKQKQELQQIIEELTNAQKQLIEAEKMASLGGLVAGVAHEINTPVGISITAATILADKTQHIQDEYKNGKMRKSDLENFLEIVAESSSIIMSNLERTGDLIQSFKKVSVDQVTENRREFNLNEYCNDVLLSLKPKLKTTKIKVTLECPADLILKSYPGTFAQIITNFIVNSLIHGFTDGQEGTILIKVEVAGENIIFSYKDSGKGMNQDVAEKIFEPFYTTNKQKGTGLGMHIVYNLVTQKLNGKIRVESQSGCGVQFIITIPR